MLQSTFFKCWDYPSCWDQKLLFLGQDYKNWDFSVKIIEMDQDCWDLSRRIKILTLLRPFESENDEKSWQIKKYQQESAKIHALLESDQDKLSRNAKIFRSRWISQSRLRLFGLDIDVKTKLRSLDQDFTTVEMHFLTLSRFSRLLRCILWWCRDRDTTETNRDPPGLPLDFQLLCIYALDFSGPIFFKIVFIKNKFYCYYCDLICCDSK